MGVGDGEGVGVEVGGKYVWTVGSDVSDGAFVPRVVEEGAFVFCVEVPTDFFVSLVVSFFESFVC